MEYKDAAVGLLMVLIVIGRVAAQTMRVMMEARK